MASVFDLITSSLDSGSVSKISNQLGRTRIRHRMRSLEQKALRVMGVLGGLFR